jgi:hypothetical protein
MLSLDYLSTNIHILCCPLTGKAYTDSVTIIGVNTGEQETTFDVSLFSIDLTLTRHPSIRPLLTRCQRINSESLTGGYSRLWHRIVVTLRQATQAGGPVRQPYARVDSIPQSGTKNLVSGRPAALCWVSRTFKYIFLFAPVST